MHHSIVTCDMLFWYSMCNAAFNFWHWIMLCDIPFCNVIHVRRFNIEHAMRHCIEYVILILNMICNIIFCNEICHFDIAHAMHTSILTFNMLFCQSTGNATFHFDMRCAIVVYTMGLLLTYGLATRHACYAPATRPLRARYARPLLAVDFSHENPIIAH